MSANLSEPRVRAGLALVLGLVLTTATATGLRWTTLDVPHFATDEPWCEGLATSLLESRGGAYSLEYVGFTVLEQPESELALLELERVPERRAAVIGYYASGGQEEVVTLGVRAPLFPVLLAASVASIGSGRVTVVAANGPPAAHPPAYRRACESPRPSWRRAQLPLTLPPLLASLGVVALVFLAARATGGLAGALLAGLALATAPVDVWCAHRVTPDTLTELVATAAALLAARALARGTWASALLAGLAGGLCVLAKQSGVLTLAAYGAAEIALLVAGRQLRSRAAWLEAARRSVAYAFGWVAGGAWWLLLVLARTSDLLQAFGIGGRGMSASVWDTPWVSFTQQRPFWAVPWTNFTLSPVLALGAVALAVLATSALTRGLPASGEARTRGAREVGLAAFSSVFFAATILHASRETRYLLPAYGPLALGLAALVDLVSERLRPRLGRGAPLLVAVALAPFLVYSAIKAREAGPSGAWELRQE